MLDVAGTPHADAPEIVVQEHRDGHGGVGVHVVGRGIETGNQADEVAGDDEQEQSAQERKNLAAFFADVLDDKGFETADDDLEEILESAGHHFQLARGQHAQDDEHDHGEPGVDDIGIDHRGVKSVVELVEPNGLRGLVDEQNRMRQPTCHDLMPPFP